MQLTSLDAPWLVRPGALTTAAFVPQVVKSWTSMPFSRHFAADASLHNQGGAVAAVRNRLPSWPVIVCNAITLVLAGGVLYLKVFHG